MILNVISPSIIQSYRLNLAKVLFKVSDRILQREFS